MQSGGALFPLSRASAHEIAKAFAMHLGFRNTADMTIEALQKIPVSQLLAAQDSVVASAQAPPWLGVTNGYGLPFQVTVDGIVFPVSPLTALQQGLSKHIPVMLGWNRDEMRIFMNKATDTTHAHVRKLVDGWLGSVVADAATREAAVTRLLTAYLQEERAIGATEVDGFLYEAVHKDWTFRLGLYLVCQAQTVHSGGAPVYVYRFDCESVVAGLGACHILEIPFCLGTFADPIAARLCGRDEKVASLSLQMQTLWTNFAKKAVPSPSWQPLPSLMVFDKSGERENAQQEQQKAFADADVARLMCWPVLLNEPPAKKQTK